VTGATISIFDLYDRPYTIYRRFMKNWKNQDV